MEDKLTIKQWRVLKGYSQKELSHKIGMKYSTYQSKEIGRRPWMADEIRDIANVLSLSIDKQIAY